MLNLFTNIQETAAEIGHRQLTHRAVVTAWLVYVLLAIPSAFAAAWLYVFDYVNVWAVSFFWLAALAGMTTRPGRTEATNVHSES